MKELKNYSIFFSFIMNILIFSFYFILNLFLVKEIYNSFIFAFIGMLFFQLMMNLLDGSKFLYYRLRDIIYAAFISLFISQIIVFSLFLIEIEFTEAFFISIAEFIVIFIIYCILSYLFNLLYFRKISNNKTLLIYNDEKQKDIFLTKMLKYNNRYQIVKTIKEHEFKAEKNYEQIICLDISKDFKSFLLNDTYTKEKNIVILPSYDDILFHSSKCLHLIDTPLFQMTFSEKAKTELFLKRCFDLVFSLFALIITSPIMLIVAIAIKLEDRGEIFYKQERLTKDYKKFHVLKFRSMIINAEKESGAVLASKNDNRITKVGRIIRKLRLDELPQLINIIKGDMSIVGPRPEREVFVQEYLKKCPEFAYRLKVKAGLTGLAQVEGKYNTTPEEKLKLDLIYITKYNFILDLVIIIKTIKILFVKESTEGIN